MTDKALQKARKDVAEAKKRYSADKSKDKDLKWLIVDTSKYKVKTSGNDLLMQLRYGKS